LPAAIDTGKRKKASRGSKKKSINSNMTKEIKEENVKQREMVPATSQSNSEEVLSTVLDPEIESIDEEMISALLSPGPLDSEMDAMLLCGSTESEGWVPLEERGRGDQALNEDRGCGAGMVNYERESVSTVTQLGLGEDVVVRSAQIDTSNLLDWDKLDWDFDLGQAWSYSDSNADFSHPSTEINGNDLESFASWLMSDLV
jgi:hypothetical protein